MQAFQMSSDGPRIWDIPISLSWWRGRTEEQVATLCDYDYATAGGRSWFASMVAAAAENVEGWKMSGVAVSGRRWVDIGGNQGYYSVALKLAGAESVRLLDPIPPRDCSAPVLNEVGVQSTVADANAFSGQLEDSALLIYVPDVRMRNVLAAFPNLQQIILDDRSDADFLMHLGWSEVRLQLASHFFLLGEPQAIKRPQHSAPPLYWLYLSPQQKLTPADLDTHWQSYLRTQERDFIDYIPLNEGKKGGTDEVADDEIPF